MSEENGSDELVYSRHPWEYQPWETWKSYEAFAVYRDMGQRQKTTVAEMLDAPIGTVQTWSQEYNWDDRVEAYDRHTDKIARQRNRNNIVQARQKMAEMGNTLLDQFDEYLSWLEEQPAEYRRERFEDLTLKEFVQTFERLSELQMNALGANDKSQTEDDVLDKLVQKMEERRQEKTVEGDVHDVDE